MGKGSAATFHACQAMLPFLYPFSRQNSQSSEKKRETPNRPAEQSLSSPQNKRKSGIHVVEQKGDWNNNNNKENSAASSEEKHSSSNSTQSGHILSGPCFKVPAVSSPSDTMAVERLWRWVVFSLVVSCSAVLICVGVTVSNVAGGGRSEETAAKWMLNTLIDPRQISSSSSSSHSASSVGGVRTTSSTANNQPYSLRHMTLGERHVSRLQADGHVLTVEALQALQAAEVVLTSGGRRDKAKKLLNHAVKLCPDSPDVWLQLGKYLEVYEQNLVEAESMYKRAFMCDPHNSRAVASIKRTDPQVQEIYSRIYRRIDSKRALIARVPQSDPGLRRAMRESYYLHIYHTNAIEGNSLSLIQTRSILETGYVVPGKTVKEHTEVLGLHDALGFINATLVNKEGPVTIEDVLGIHKRVMGYTEPHVAGFFRNHQVYIANHVPPAPDLIEQEMENFFTWLASESVSKLHPIELAGLAHYWLVHIHPFVDGNGRTARLLMNLILMKSGYPPVTISFSDRGAYYEFLQLGNRGDIRPFLRFVAACTERTLDSYLEVTDKHIFSSKDVSATDTFQGGRQSLKIEALLEDVPMSYEIRPMSLESATEEESHETARLPAAGPPERTTHSHPHPHCPFEDNLCS